MPTIHKLTVPFLYEASVLPPRCRNAVPRVVRDSVDVEILSYTGDELKVAIVGTNYKGERFPLLWNGDSLIREDVEFIVGQDKRTVPFDEVVKNTTDSAQYPYSCPGTAAPFHNCWQGAREAKLLRRSYLGSEGVLSREEIGTMRVLSDNREQIVQVIKHIAAGRLVHDGVMMCYASEPTYHTITFGLGGNHGSTSLSVGSYARNSLLPNLDSEFNILQLDHAIAYATKVAENRGDTKSIPMRVSDRFEVLIPEAIQMPMRPLVLPE